MLSIIRKTKLLREAPQELLPFLRGVSLSASSSKIGRSPSGLVPSGLVPWAPSERSRFPRVEERVERRFKGVEEVEWPQVPVASVIGLLPRVETDEEVGLVTVVEDILKYVCLSVV